MDPNKNNLDINEIDRMIKKIFSDFIKKKDLDVSKPISLNLQFSDDEYDNDYEDVESFLETSKKIFVTLHTPYNLNKLRFDIDTDSKKIIVKSHDYVFYKEFWFVKDVDYKSLDTTYKNNVLELAFNKK